MVDVMEAVRLFVAGAGWDETYAEQAMREEFERIVKSSKTTGTLDMDAALELWRTERARRYPELATASPTAVSAAPSSRKKGTP